MGREGSVRDGEGGSEVREVIGIQIIRLEETLDLRFVPVSGLVSLLR